MPSSEEKQEQQLEVCWCSQWLQKHKTINSGFIAALHHTDLMLNANPDVPGDKPTVWFYLWVPGCDCVHRPQQRSHDPPGPRSTWEPPGAWCRRDPADLCRSDLQRPETKISDWLRPAYKSTYSQSTIRAVLTGCWTQHVTYPSSTACPQWS